MSEWFPLFKISAAAGTGSYYMWTGGATTSDITSCHMTPESPCDTHYKHPMMQKWNHLSIQKVNVFNNSFKRLQLIAKTRNF